MSLPSAEGYLLHLDEMHQALLYLYCVQPNVIDLFLNLTKKFLCLNLTWVKYYVNHLLGKQNQFTAI